MDWVALISVGGSIASLVGLALAWRQARVARRAAREAVTAAARIEEARRIVVALNRLPDIKDDLALIKQSLGRPIGSGDGDLSELVGLLNAHLSELEGMTEFQDLSSAATRMRPHCSVLQAKRSDPVAEARFKESFAELRQNINISWIDSGEEQSNERSRSCQSSAAC